MKISIAMATYNGAKFLGEQLRSIARQTLLPDELIIVDDCSTDGTERVIRDFAKDAAFKVEFYRNSRNLGYCGNFNAALLKTTGDLVLLSDQDDVWFPSKIAHLADLSARNPHALLLMNDAALTDENLRRVGLTKIGQLRAAGYATDRFVMGCCCAIKRPLLDICLPVPVGYQAHDNWIVGFADALSVKMVDDTVLQYYRRHGANESQFIANNVVKVSRFNVLFETLRKVASSHSSEQSKQQRGQLLLRIDGIERSKAVANHESCQLLEAYLGRTQAALRTLEARIGIRRKPFVTRIISATKYMGAGGYTEAKGFQSMLRDIFG